ncbi:MAG: hypothetical protein WBP45_13325 [Daejeonella sp.]
MNKADLLQEISQVLNKAKVKRLADAVGEEEDLISDLLDLSFYREREIAFRAAWILEQVEINFTDMFLPIVPKFLKVYPDQMNLSCQRHYTKIMMNLTNQKAIKGYQAVIWSVEIDPIIECTFEWLINPETSVAVCVNCMDILFNLKNRGKWISEELKAQTEFLMRNGGPAIQSRGKKIIQELKRE